MGNRRINTCEALERVAQSICDAFRFSGPASKLEFDAEFLEYYESDGTPDDCQLIVNAKEIPGVKAWSYVAWVADAIAAAFNAVTRKRERENGSWYACSDINFWDKEGNEVDCDGDVDHVQACIFQYYR